MEVIFAVFSFILGLIVGSFLNVVTLRYKTGISLSGRSFCFSCGHALSLYDLIPILSFLFQGGRCRYCGVRISVQYPSVELLTGVIFLFVFLKTYEPNSAMFIPLLYWWFVFSILVSIIIYDLRHKIIPDALVYMFIALSGIMVILSVVSGVDYMLHLATGPLLGAPFALLWFLSKGRWIGLGDAKLALGIGWLLNLSLGISAVIMAFWLGALYGVTVIVFGNIKKKYRHLFPRTKRFTMKSEIPFAPFLVLGTVLSFLYEISFADLQSLFNRFLS